MMYNRTYWHVISFSVHFSVYPTRRRLSLETSERMGVTISFVKANPLYDVKIPSNTTILAARMSPPVKFVTDSAISSLILVIITSPNYHHLKRWQVYSMHPNLSPKQMRFATMTVIKRTMLKCLQLRHRAVRASQDHLSALTNHIMFQAEIPCTYSTINSPPIKESNHILIDLDLVLHFYGWCVLVSS